MTDYDTLVRKLHDIEAIKRLKARYFRAMDQKNWDLFRDVFSSDCLMEVPEADLWIIGNAKVASTLEAILASAQTCHHGHMPEIELTGPDTATGVWAMFDYVEFPADGAGTRSGLQGYGHYEETYRRIDGAWKIQTLRLSRLRVDSIS